MPRRGAAVFIDRVSGSLNGFKKGRKKEGSGFRLRIRFAPVTSQVPNLQGQLSALTPSNRSAMARGTASSRDAAAAGSPILYPVRGIRREMVKAGSNSQGGALPKPAGIGVDVPPPVRFLA